MWPVRFFAPAYWAATYWPEGVTVPPVPPVPPQERPRSGISFWRRMERGPWFAVEYPTTPPIEARLELALAIEVALAFQPHVPADFVMGFELDAASEALHADPAITGDVAIAKFRPRVTARRISTQTEVEARARMAVHIDTVRRVHSLRQERVLREILTETLAR